MADQHDPSEPQAQDEPPRPGQPRQPEPLERDPWAPPAQRVAMGKGPMDKAADEQGMPAPRPPVAEQPTLTSYPAMPGPPPWCRPPPPP
ncbi:hypothetical protein V2K49_18415, partial [Streptomyces sp. DSM 41602]|nr:hypothetical protein [Streptomyces sp. DSM 41602]